MWQSAAASTIALALQQHLLFGGLGEAIAVIVGGVVSVIALHRAKRSAVRPAPAPRPAPASQRNAAPPAYGEPAPPTTPDRRLHPGPISLSAPTPPHARKGGDEDDDAAPGVATSLFSPEIIILGDEPDNAASPAPRAAPPVLRPLGQLSAEWRAQSSLASLSASAFDPEFPLASAPIWNHAPFARPVSVARLTLDLAPDAGAAIPPPIWRAPIFAEPPETLAPLASRDLAAVAPETPEMAETRAPIWASPIDWSGATQTPAADVATDQAEARAERQGESAEPTPPIWPSFLHPE